MAVITISRQTFIGGQELGEQVARKLGYRYYTREDLVAEAASKGIMVDMLEEAATKPPGAIENIHRERDRYVACITMLLCEKALRENIVYNGHAGHMLLLGIPNLLRINAVADMEYRIRSVRKRMGYSRSEAKKYIKQVDERRNHWVRFLYLVDWHNPVYYDLSINMGRTGLERATDIVTGMAMQTKYQFTDCTVHSLRNLHLASKAHFILASDERTRSGQFMVNADDGIVQVTGRPHSADALALAPEVLANIEGVREVNVTVAFDTVLYIGERFDPNSHGFSTTVTMARERQWAVELITMPAALSDRELIHICKSVKPDKDNSYSNIETNDNHQGETGIHRCLEALRKAGCSGGSNHFYDTPRALIRALQRRTDCKLLILGALFMQKRPSARQRLRSELKNLLAEHLCCAIVEADELEEFFAVKAYHILQTVIWLLLSIAILFCAYEYQDEIVRFIASDPSVYHRVMVVAVIILVTPLFAFSYGSFTQHILKWLHLD